MYSALLAILYLAFVSLGLPDSILGAGWPVMHAALGVPSSAAGLITMLISGGTILSSLCSHRFTKRFGTGAVTACSVLLTALALLGFSVSNRFWQLCLFALPYGLGAGGVDVSVNNFAAIHYSSRHMNWLHCMWGVGAAVGPFIMGRSLTRPAGWAGGYRFIGLLQLFLTAFLLLALPLWKKADPTARSSGETRTAPISLFGAFRIRGVPSVLLLFLGYAALESTAILWASSYLVQCRGVNAVTAARFGSLFLVGITAGRFLCGFISNRLGDKRMIRLGCLLMLAGIALILLPAASGLPALAGLVVFGLGCAPVYPAVMHSTPANFGRENSQAIVGLQMAFAYTGSTFMPPLFGLLASFGVRAFPLFLLFFTAVMLAASEHLNRALRRVSR